MARTLFTNRSTGAANAIVALCTVPVWQGGRGIPTGEILTRSCCPYEVESIEGLMRQLKHVYQHYSFSQSHLVDYKKLCHVFRSRFCAIPVLPQIQHHHYDTGVALLILINLLTPTIATALSSGYCANVP
jgi:hypothetical protein